MRSSESNPRKAWSRRDRVVFIVLLLVCVLGALPLALQIANGGPVLEGPPWMLGVAAAGVAMAIGFPLGKWLKDRRFPPLLVLAVVVLTGLPQTLRGVSSMIEAWPPSPSDGVYMLLAALVSGGVGYLVATWFMKRRPASD